MSKSVTELVKQLKEQGQDFEWYPSTDEMISKITPSIIDEMKSGSLYNLNILDIGAGNGKVLEKIKENLQKEGKEYISFNKYAIEKSDILIEQMQRDVVVIGGDFYEISLIEKTYFNIVFCNPPYSEYESFASRIIKELKANRIFLILPSRWKDSKEIKNAIYSRKDDLKCHNILGEFDFLNAQRQARAKVEIVEFIFNKYRFDDKNNDLFISSLKECFNIDLENIQNRSEKDEEFENDIKREINEVKNEDLIEKLISLYNKEFEKLNYSLNNFNNIPKSILSNLRIDKESIAEAIQGEIKGIKFVFWKELFNRLDSINERLIPKYRLRLADTFSSLNIDFNFSNIKSACLYVIKNANYYVDLGVLDLFDDFTEHGALEYKSNKKFIFSSWRHTDDKFKAKKLDYRVVYPCGSLSSISELWDKLSTIAKLLGFIPCSTNYNLINHYKNYDYISGQFEDKSEGDCFFINHNKEEEIFFSFRAYKNGNLHFNFNKEFIACFNIAVGKLRKWINNKAEAKENFPECNDEIIDKAFLLVDKMQIKKDDVKLLN